MQNEEIKIEAVHKRRRTHYELFEEVVYGETYKPYPSSSNVVSVYRKEVCEKHAEGMWNKFYKNNTSNFFKDRHYLWREFTELEDDAEEKTVLEIGCGVGNSTFPIIENNANLKIYAFDFSEVALKVLIENPKFIDYRNQIHVFHWDPATSSSPNLFDHPLQLQNNNNNNDDQWNSNLLPAHNSCDLGLLIFVLSAISPDKMGATLRHVHPYFKNGAAILFRDYADGDLAKTRFESKKSKLGDNYYLRSDGTFSFFFTPEYLSKLCEENGFIAVDVSVVEKEVVNHKENMKMNRNFIQGKLIKVSTNFE